jgi:methylenetetrahydrofolate--tRNA-(uracil-5-)-methyltransferase
MHRNTYINAPTFLKSDLSLKSNENIYIGGQLSGVEGYVESAATGLYIAYAIYSRLKNMEFKFPRNTMLFSLINYIINANPNDFSPMNSNYGIMYGVTKNNRLEVAENSIKSIKIFIKDYE